MKLIIGFGNPDREDDGLAWYALLQIAERLGRPSSTVEEGFSPIGLDPDLWFVLQLTPEMSEDIAAYDEVIFVDAHTGAYAEDVRVVEVQPALQTSPLTHHLTPEMLLSITQQVFQSRPAGRLVSIKGENFGFKRGLSPTAQARLDQALELILI